MKISAVILTRCGEAKLPQVLPTLKEIADEVVVVIDDETEDESLIIARSFTDLVYIVPNYGYIEAHLPEMIALCSGDWIFRLDDDETLSHQWNRDLVSRLIADKYATHYWIPRRWLVTSGDRFICTAPWYPDYQMRLFRNIPSLLKFPKKIHEPTQVAGEARYLTEAYIYHWDLIWNSREAREKKVSKYEKLNPGGAEFKYYLYEDYYWETTFIDDISLPIKEINTRLNFNESESQSAFEVDIKLIDAPQKMTANETYVVTISVCNKSNRILQPESNFVKTEKLFLANHWFCYQSNKLEIYEWESPRTPLPTRIAPGEVVQCLLPVKAPSQEGQYILQGDMVEEGIAWFSQSSHPGIHEMREIEVLPSQESKPSLEIVDSSNPNPDIYDESVYSEWVEQYANCASIVVSSLRVAFPIKKLVDVGCGPCIFANEFSRQGVEVVAADGSSHAQSHALPSIQFVQIDFRDIGFENHLKSLNKMYDVAMCLEVAEHLPQKYARQLVRSLTNLSKIVVFTAAQPGQGGLGHFNEQPHEYWQNLFADFGYLLDRDYTQKLRILWKSSGVIWWLSDNLLIFRKQTKNYKN